MLCKLHMYASCVALHELKVMHEHAVVLSTVYDIRHLLSM